MSIDDINESFSEYLRYRIFNLDLFYGKTEVIDNLEITDVDEYINKTKSTFRYCNYVNILDVSYLNYVRCFDKKINSDMYISDIVKDELECIYKPYVKRNNQYNHLFNNVIIDKHNSFKWNYEFIPTFDRISDEFMNFIKHTCCLFNEKNVCKIYDELKSFIKSELENNIYSDYNEVYRQLIESNKIQVLNDIDDIIETIDVYYKRLNEHNIIVAIMVLSYYLSYFNIFEVYTIYTDKKFIDNYIDNQSEIKLYRI